MVLAIALVFYIGLLSTAFYSGFYLRNAANIVTKDLAFSLRQAQVYSMSGRQGSDWGVALTDDAIIIFKGSSYASRATTFDESHAIPVTLVVTGFNETVFSRITGYPSATSTVVITGAGRTRTVVVNEQGIVDQY
ncbi:TPA: hypothetical protein DDZ49_04760 [Candidatus Wolfebacteria bacterium]|nr:hypothetical protein [Candidatus Wolfebacteria bacterium]HBD17871.1 hypothetical protein [Candidatus Wolfebacteria bacterium]HBN87441.1 hypothetical protein [Candidatus Wolfebacteria bacterium]HBT74538.1 hypothetical protein [Candidatus Wolfebacteria bacterium]HCM52728.1 hypothetical protein [Candidatus Wolfebacteria bacterium]